MNVPQDKLDAWAETVNRIRRDCPKIGKRIAAREYREADELATDLQMTAAALLSEMERAGSARPSSLPPANGVPLHLLDTPANRRLARALREAYEAAQAVDYERGYGEDGPAEHIGELLGRVEQEVFGPAGQGEGSARE